MNTTLVCTKCGSSDVQSQAWVNANDHTQIDFSLSETTKNGNWCNDCEEHVPLMPEEEFLVQQEDRGVMLVV